MIKIPIIPTKNIYTKNILKKPSWIRTKLPINLNNINNIKNILRNYKLHSVCEEALCPNLNECFNNKTATFMILGNICTRKCMFCKVKKGRPLIPDIKEPEKLAKVIKKLNLMHVVITSVNRDDLHDGGAKHFSQCIKSIRKKNIFVKIEILVPDFRKCLNKALKFFYYNPPDIFNHNLETIPRLYKKIRKGANYYSSLKLLYKFKKLHPNLPTKSGLMLGLGETNNEIIQVIKDLYNNGVTMLTLGQYLQPSPFHAKVKRYISYKEFEELKEKAISIGINYVSSGPLVRSSYYADKQFKKIIN